MRVGVHPYSKSARVAAALALPFPIISLLGRAGIIHLAPSVVWRFDALTSVAVLVFIALTAKIEKSKADQDG